MSKTEFLNKLEEALLENMDISQARPHLKYYKDYIESELKKGRKEEDVIASLQNPRLIAKNIINNEKIASKYDSSINYDSSDYFNSEADKNNTKGYSSQGFSFSVNGKPVNKFLIKLLSILILVIALVLVVSIISGIILLVFKVILPVAIIGFLIYIITKCISGGKKL